MVGTPLTIYMKAIVGLCDEKKSIVDKYVG